MTRRRGALAERAVRTDGTEHGFGWKEGDITSAIMVKVPTNDLRHEQAATIREMLMIFGIVGLLLIGLIYFSFERIIHHRLRKAAQIMDQIASDPTTPTRIADSSARPSRGHGQCLQSHGGFRGPPFTNRWRNRSPSATDELKKAREQAEAASRAKSEFFPGQHEP